MRTTLVFFSLLIFAFTSCGVATSDKSDSDEKKADSITTITSESTNADIQLKSFPPSPSYEDAVIEGFQYDNGTFTYTLPDGDYNLGVQTADAEKKMTMCANSAKGQHIHLIVDNKPYTSHYVPTFEQELKDGTHYILTFLSRSYHESIKTDDAHRAIKAEVNDGSFTDVEPITQPMIFYSRPKGTYVGDDTENVMLDFYPVNAQLGNGYTLKVDVNGDAVFIVSEWTPYFLEGLPMGKNTITLTLLDEDGEVIDSPYNPVSRTFTLKADPADVK